MPSPLSSAARVTSDPDHLASPGGPYRGVELVTRDGASLPLVSARLHAEARGGLARVVLEQRFENSYDETLHVTYRMPLPADGAVSGYEFELGGRRVVGKVDRKQAARARFEQAIAQGKTAGLLEQDRDDIFTQQLGNLPPRDGVTARITVDVKLAWLPEGEWELRFPTVIGPRYLGTADTEADAAATAVAVAADGVPARLRLSLAVHDARTGAIHSPSHALRVTGDDVELRSLAGAALDRDLVVRWPVAKPAVGMSLDVTRPAGGDDMYGLVTIVPPAPAAKVRAVPRDLIILLDTSGSMDGAPLASAKRVLAHVIEALSEGDRLEMIEFSNRPGRYHAEPVAATPAEKRAAVKWLNTRRAGGGTEMRTAVVEALRALRPGAQRQVVLATDGYIGGEEQVVRELQARLPDACRLHFVGVGSSVNRTLSTAMARAGRGAEVLCGPDEDAERAARRLFDRTRAPILVDVELSGSAVVERAPAALPDVFEGAPLVAAVKLQPGELRVRGTTADGPWQQVVQLGACRPGDGHAAIAQLFGRERVADLEARRFAGEQVDAEVEAVGLTYQISTRRTSWVAIDEVVRQVGPSRSEAVPQELPYGTTMAAFGLRAASGDDGDEAFDDFGEFSDEMALPVELRTMSAQPMSSDRPIMQSARAPSMKMALAGPAGRRAPTQPMSVLPAPRPAAPSRERMTMGAEHRVVVRAEDDEGTRTPAPRQALLVRPPTWLVIVWILAALAAIWWLFL